MKTTVQTKHDEETGQVHPDDVEEWPDCKGVIALDGTLEIIDAAGDVVKRYAPGEAAKHGGAHPGEYVGYSVEY